MGVSLESLYTVDPKSAMAGFGVRRYAQFLNASGLNTLLRVVTSAVPLDRVRVITGYGAYGVAGAAQTFDAAGPAFEVAYGRLLGGFSIDTIFQEGYTESCGLLNGSFNSEKEIVLMPGEGMIIYAHFSGAVAANTLYGASIIGYEIPRGNFQF